MTKAKRIILFSIDGLRADLCRLPPGQTPALSALRTRGLRAERALAVYPTVTLTNHATIATGRLSEAHGIVGNTRFKTDNGEFRDWYLEASDIKAPTLWQRAREAGLKAALLRWPTTGGADADIVVPELFDAQAGDDAKSWALTCARSTPWFIEKMKEHTSAAAPASREDFDQWVTDAVVYLAKHTGIELIMAHLVSLDHEQHDHGCNSPQAARALSTIDALIGKVIANIDLNTTCLMVFGDHGMTDFTQRFNINALFKQRGWITVHGGVIESWRALAHINCGQAAVYVAHPFIHREVLRTLRSHAGDRYEVIDRIQLDKLGAFPGALCAVDCLAGYSMGECLDGDLFTPADAVHGEHGHGFRIEHPNRQAGFVIAGPGIGANSRIDMIQLMDIAPLAASILGIPWHTVGMRKNA